MTAARITPPPVLLALSLGVAWLADRARPLPLFPTPQRAVGIVIVAIAVACVVATLLLMRRHQTPIEPWHEPRHLLTTGPFRISRNPIYVSLIVVALGAALIANSLWFLAAAALLVVLLDVLIIRNEERMAERVFGGEYDAYRRRVRRWL